MTMTLRHALAFAFVMGVTAAAVVWWLERYQADLLAAKFAERLRLQDEFDRRFPDDRKEGKA